MDTLLCIIAIVAIALFLYFNSNEKKFKRQTDLLYRHNQATIEALRKKQENGEITLQEFIYAESKCNQVYNDLWWELFIKYKVRK